jgi:hypothetical protein
VAIYKGRKLVIRRDRVVVYDGEAIGFVGPDSADRRVQTRDWVYSHSSGVTLKDLHPNWDWARTAQGAQDKQAAARNLAALHLAIIARDGAVADGKREATEP